MSNNIVPIGQAKMPAAMRERLQSGAAVNKNFSDGVVDSFPRLSIRGKTFRIRRDGKEMLLTDQYNQAVPNLDVILVNASRTIAKTYYEKGFDPGDTGNPPNCWSLDSVKPDPSVVNKVNPTCADCPMNAFGSKVSDRGGAQRAGKACSDSRRIAVVMPGDLANPTPMPFLLNVPQASLKNLKEYAGLLDNQGWEPAACVTRLQFDPEAEFPKLKFYFIDGLQDAEYAKSLSIAESPTVAGMLNAPDFDAMAARPQGSNAQAQPRVRQEMPKMVDPDEVVPQERAQVQRVASLSQPIEAQKMPPITGNVFTDKPQERTPQAVQQTLIELPDGKLFDPSTGEYVERAAPKVEMPQLDPNTMALPDGRFFNSATKQFVTGPEVGAGLFVIEEKVKRTRTAKPKTDRQEDVDARKATLAKAEEEQEEEQPVQAEAKAEATTNGIAAAPAGLEDVLRSVMPTRR